MRFLSIGVSVHGFSFARISGGKRLAFPPATIAILHIRGEQNLLPASDFLRISIEAPPKAATHVSTASSSSMSAGVRNSMVMERTANRRWREMEDTTLGRRQTS